MAMPAGSWPRAWRRGRGGRVAAAVAGEGEGCGGPRGVGRGPGGDGGAAGAGRGRPRVCGSGPVAEPGTGPGEGWLCPREVGRGPGGGGGAGGWLRQWLAKGKDVVARGALAEGLAAMAGRLEPAEAARVCAEAARLLN